MARAPSAIATLIKRELLTSLRSWKSLAMLLLLLAVLYVVAFGALNGTAGNAYAAAQVMPFIFNAQIALLLFAAMTIVPATAAVSLCKERTEGSYDLLLTTLIPPTRIALGKLAAVLILFVLVATALLPFTGLVYFFAGVDLYRSAQAAAVIVPVAVSGAALGLWISTLFNNPARAIFFTGGAVLLVNAGLPLLAAWFMESRFFLLVFSPFPLLTKNMGMAADWGTYGMFAAYQVIVALMALAGALYNVGRIRLFRPVGDALTRRLPRSPAGRFIPLGDRTNPISVRERYGSPLARGRAGQIVFCVLFFGYSFIVFGYLGGRNGEFVLLAAAYIERLLMLALLPAVVAVCWVRDMEATTWDMMRLTLLQPRDILTGKIAGVFRVVLPLFGPVYLANCLILGFIALSWGSRDEFVWTLAFFGELIFFPVHALMVIVAAMVGACFTRGITTGVAAAYGSLIICLMAFGFATGMAIDGNPELAGMAIMHASLCGLALVIGLGVVIVRIDHLWQSFTFDYNPNVRLERDVTPPPLPTRKD